MKVNSSFYVLLIMSIMACAKQPHGKTEKPNVIVILADDQGYGDLSCHGNPHLKTPNLDKLHKESVRLTDFHTSSVCTPTRSQLLTGLDAIRNGAYNYGFGKSTIFQSYPDTLGNKVPIHLMSEYFKENGYSTGHFGKWHLGDFFPSRSMDRGFDSTLTFPSASVWQASNYWNNDCFDDVYYRNGKRVKTEGYCNDLWFDQTMDFIKGTKNTKKPFFVYLATNTSHTPLFVNPKYCEPYTDLPKLTAKYYKGLPELTTQYYGMLANLDESYGRLDAFLKENGLKENTIVIYMSDNGGTFGVEQYNAGMTGMKGKLQEGGHRAPCFIRWPNGISRKDVDVNELTIVQDMLPTLIDLCDLKDPWDSQFDGVSLAKSIRGEQQDLNQRKSVVQFSMKREGLNGYAVLWNKWRLLDGNKLYNVATDLAQKKNVANDFPEITKQLQEYYLNWFASVKPSLAKHTKIEVGHPGFKSMDLTCFDWLNLEGVGNPSQQFDIRQGKNMHGYWNIDVMQAGRYRFEFRRWPKEADAEIDAGLPPYYTKYSKLIGNTQVPATDSDHKWGDLSVGGVYPIGKALPIKKAAFIMGDVKECKPVVSTDKSVVFEFDMSTGQKRFELDFLDSNDQILCGAYYAEITKLN